MPTRSFTLKRKRKESGDSVIIAFHSRWAIPLQQSGFSIVYRKHRPSAMDIRCMFAYCSKPISSIVAKMPVLAVKELTIDDALKLSSESMHTEDEILKYAQNGYFKYEKLVVYEIGKIEYASSPIPLEMLVDKYDFCPSPSFIPLSINGRLELTKLGGFSNADITT
jgi:hypothetical protein